MDEDITSGCLHQDAVKWNPYNGVVQCHRCGVTFIPMTAGAQKCQFCGGDEGGIESQDMGEGRVMRLCGTCRGHIAAGIARETPTTGISHSEGETMETEEIACTGIIHRPCGAYMEWTGEGDVYRCRECGETLDLAAGDDEDE